MLDIGNKFHAVKRNARYAPVQKSRVFAYFIVIMFFSPYAAIQRRGLVIVFLYLTVQYALPAQSIPFLQKAAPFNMTTPRDKALGGAHAASSDGIYALFNNAAAISSVQESSFVGFGVFIDDFNHINEVAPILDAFPIPEDMIIERASAGIAFAPPTFGFSGPFMLGVAGKNYAAGFFNGNYTTSVLSYESGASNQDKVTCRINSTSDFIFSAGRSWNPVAAPGYRLDLGIAGKIVFRTTTKRVEQEVSVASVNNRYLPDIGDTRARNLAAVAFNLGLLFRAGDRFAFGITLNDVPNAALAFSNEERADGAEDSPFFINVPEVGAGFSVTIINRQSLRWTLMADFHNALSFLALTGGAPRNILLCIGAGMEWTLFKTVMIRAGFADFSPAGGIGIDAGIARFDLAVYGTEYGTEIQTYTPIGIAFSLRMTLR